MNFRKWDISSENNRRFQMDVIYLLQFKWDKAFNSLQTTLFHLNSTKRKISSWSQLLHTCHFPKVNNILLRMKSKFFGVCLIGGDSDYAWPSLINGHDRRRSCEKQTHRRLAWNTIWLKITVGQDCQSSTLGITDYYSPLQFVYLEKNYNDHFGNGLLLFLINSKYLTWS